MYPKLHKRLLSSSKGPNLYGWKRYHQVEIQQDSGVGCGSDFPGEIEFSPFTAIQAAVTRNGIHKKGDYDKSEAISVSEAVQAYTTGSAWAEGTEEHKGILKKGMLADYILLSDDIFQTNSQKITEISVIMTVTGGNIVYSQL